MEKVDNTGAGVYVAVLDTGLVPNWQQYFPEDRIATDLGTGFVEDVTFLPDKDDPCDFEFREGTLHETTFIGSTGESGTHGTHDASTILGYFYRSNSDLESGFDTGPIVVRGIAPDVTIIPVKVLADYQIPALPKCDDPDADQKTHAVFGTDEMVAAGINYVAELKETVLADSPVVINMSLGGPELDQVEQDALDRAIAAGVIVVASAGNNGETGMGFPGAYDPVISAGAAGWNYAWVHPDFVGDATADNLGDWFYRMFWLQSDLFPYRDVTEDEGQLVDNMYVVYFSSRALTDEGQNLDVLAPGVWVRGPFPGDPGYSHLPWFSKGIGDLAGNNVGNFYYLSGTSMAAPHVAATAALVLESYPGLTQSQMEALLRDTAIPFPDTGSGGDPYINLLAGPQTWDTSCDDDGDDTTAEVLCDPVGFGLLQADEAVAQGGAY